MTAAEGRKFGLAVGGAFLLLALILWWRGKVAAVPYVAGLGTMLVLGGLVAPAALGPVQRAWMRLAHLMSRVTTPILMGVIYFLVLTPIGLALRLAGRNPLVHRSRGAGVWYERGGEKPDPNRMERQF